jgi:hypothetical protein
VLENKGNMGRRLLVTGRSARGLRCLLPPGSAGGQACPTPGENLRAQSGCSQGVINSGSRYGACSSGPCRSMKFTGSP